MYIDVYQMRYAIRKAYKSVTWQQKVDKMHDSQVQAIYYSFRRRGLV